MALHVLDAAAAAAAALYEEEEEERSRRGGSSYVRLLDGEDDDNDDIRQRFAFDDDATAHQLAHNTLGFWGGVALVVSDIIGSGIFASPGIVLHWSGSVGASLAMWVMAGVITYVGFACLAELSVMDPSAGGIFYYLRTNFGGAVAFSWTFTNFTVVVPGALAALALTFAHYLASALPGGWETGGFEADADWRLKAVACAAVCAVVGLNCMSAAQGGTVAKVFLSATLSGCLFVVVLGVVFACGAGAGRSDAGRSDGRTPPLPPPPPLTGSGLGRWGVFTEGDDATTPFTAYSETLTAYSGAAAGADAGGDPTAHRYPATDPRSVAAHNFSPSNLFKGTKGFASLGVGLISALWAYSGAMDIASVAEELRDAERALPKVGTTGLVVVSAAYVLMNVAYLMVLPADVISSSAAAAAATDDADEKAMGVVFANAVAGRWAGLVVTCVVALSSFGALNSCLYLSARQFYATARDGLFPALLTHTNAKGAPYAAILSTGAWTVALITVMSSFATLVNYLSAAMWLFYGLVGVAVIVSRRREPDAPRPYRVPGYPVVPCVYVILCVSLSGCTFVAAPLPCAAALLLVAAALPVHWVWFVWLPRRRARRSGSLSSSSTTVVGGGGGRSGVHHHSGAVGRGPPGGLLGLRAGDDDVSIRLPPSQYGPVS